MKKVILSLVFVLVTGTSFMNANSSLKKQINFSGDIEFCFDEAIAISKSAAIWGNLSFEEEDDLFLDIFTGCMAT